MYGYHAFLEVSSVACMEFHDEEAREGRAELLWKHAALAQSGEGLGPRLTSDLSPLGQIEIEYMGPWDSLITTDVQQPDRHTEEGSKVVQWSRSMPSSLQNTRQNKAFLLLT